MNDSLKCGRLFRMLLVHWHVNAVAKRAIQKSAD